MSTLTPTPLPGREREVLNLGCGNKIMAGAVNHDLRKHRAEVDVAWDLNERPWPWRDGTFDLIVARAVFEHLRMTLIETMDECWRVLRPGGDVWMKLPFWASEGSYQDPTHYWRFTLATCDVFDPRTRYGQSYGFYTERKWKIVKGARLNRGRSSFTIRMRKLGMTNEK